MMRQIRRQIAKLVGVAPTNRNRGSLRGKRTIGGGRVTVRNALYMPTVVAKLHDSKVKAVFDGLVQQGKPKLAHRRHERITDHSQRHDPKRKNLAKCHVLHLKSKSIATALIAAQQTGRRAFLMELDPLYCDVIVKRWEEFTGRKAEREKAPATAEA